MYLNSISSFAKAALCSTALIRFLSGHFENLIWWEAQVSQSNRTEALIFCREDYALCTVVKQDSCLIQCTTIRHDIETHSEWKYLEIVSSWNPFQTHFPDHVLHNNLNHLADDGRPKVDGKYLPPLTPINHRQDHFKGKLQHRDARNQLGKTKSVYTRNNSGPSSSKETI